MADEDEKFQLVKKDLFLDISQSKAYSIAIFGSTRSGKSYMLNRLLDRYFSVNRIPILMTESPYSADEYKVGWFAKSKELIRADGFYPGLIKAQFRINQLTENKYHFLNILDDQTQGKTSKVLNKVCTIGRNSNISLVVVGQKLSMISPQMRNNTNFVFLGRINADNEIKELIQTYLISYFPPHLKMNEMIRLYRKLTSNYHFIFIDMLNEECYITKMKD